MVLDVYVVLTIMSSSFCDEFEIAEAVLAEIRGVGARMGVGYLQECELWHAFRLMGWLRTHEKQVRRPRQNRVLMEAMATTTKGSWDGEETKKSGAAW